MIKDLIERLAQFLSDCVQTVIEYLTSAFDWVVDNVLKGAKALIVACWNWAVETFWTFYATVVSWIGAIVARFIPDLPDQSEFIEEFIERVHEWDKIVPIHEIFSMLLFLVTYHVGKYIIRLATYCVTMLRKLWPM